MGGDGLGGPGPEAPVDDSIIVSPRPNAEDGTVSAGSDLPKKTKTTLGDYLSAVTRDPAYGNKYTISPGSTPASVIDNDGAPAALNLGNNGADSVFADHQVYNQLNEYSNSQIDDPSVSPLTEVLTKGQRVKSTGPDAVDGHELLRNVQEAATGIDSSGKYASDLTTTSPVVKRTLSVLGNNRFTSAAAYSVEPANYSTIQKKFGEYDPNATIVTTQQMSKIGRSISLRSTGEYKARRPGDDPDSAKVRNYSTLPGEAQLALTKISTLDLDARETFSDIFGEEFGTDLSSDKKQYGDSYGNLSNCIEHFDSIIPIGMTALAIALILATQVAVRALLASIALVSLGRSGTTNVHKRDQIGRYFSGKYRLRDFDGDPKLLGISLGVSPELLGLHPVDYDYGKAVTTGMAVFFGGPRDVLGAALSTINPFGGETFNRVKSAPGYYAVFARNLTRSLNTISNSIKNAYDNVSGGASAVDIVQGTGAVIESIRSSKAIAVLNAFAILGDRILTLEAQGFSVENPIHGIDRISKTDALPDNPASHVMKSRERQSLKLAWRNASTATRLLLPESVISAGSAVGHGTALSYQLGMSDNLNGTDQARKRVKTSKQSRLDPGDVAIIEAELDAEYVPFYFHDLRTNEIISFHAFLESLTDGFSVNITQTEGVGRIDKVGNYASTERSISFLFNAVATSYEDFDEMYAKINKLLTLAYPSYTAGTLVESLDGNTKFTMPFSQVMAGSPLIRLRIGDVIRSNYSRFSLSRIFGLGSPDFKINSAVVPEASQAKLEKARNTVDRMKSGIFQEGDIVKIRPNGSPASSTGEGYKPAIDQGGGLGAALGAAIGLSGPDPIPPLIVNHPMLAKVALIPTGDDNLPAQLAVVLEGPDADVSPDATIKWLVSNSDIIIDNEVIARAVDSGVDANFDTDIQDFFSPKNNIIVRSFEEYTAGKGLAGFIKSIEIDLMKGPWEVDRHGSRAPQMLSINVSFMPIHDIPPGLDSDGFNRAPIYNVGSHMNSISGDGPQDSDSLGRDRFNASHRSVTGIVNRSKK